MENEKYRKPGIKSTRAKNESLAIVGGKSFEKRVKRRIIGRPHEFFVATSPHLNTVCHGEIRSLKLPVDRLSAGPGGISFSGWLTDCYAANLNLRTANRIIMRIGTFTAGNFRKLEKWAKNCPWELYLSPCSRIHMSVSAKKCRLYHTTAIQSHFLSGMENNAGGLDINRDDKDGSSAHIFIRGENDHFTVSVDSSGELLYKRGIKTHGAKAPLRESLAAAALLLAGYTGDRPLIDPMCGSGTGALEAAMIAGNIPPGWRRTFSFMNWPSFRPGPWEHMRRNARARFKFHRSPIIFASDVDASAIAALEKTVHDAGFADMVEVSCRDFFSTRPRNLGGGDGFIFLNPPYGIRLATKQESSRLYRGIVEKLKTDYKNWTCIMVSPYPEDLNSLSLSGKSHRLFHGGLELGLAIGRI